MTFITRALHDNTGLIRWSAIKASLVRNGAEAMAERIERDLNDFGRTCDTHGYLEDPIVAVEPVRKQVIVACPLCSSPELLAQWEAQGADDQS